MHFVSVIAKPYLNISADMPANCLAGGDADDTVSEKPVRFKNG